MRILLGWLFTPLFLISFFLVLLVFHALQWLGKHLGGYKAHKISVDWMKYFLLWSVRCSGARIRLHKTVEIPENVPLVIISNHQSMFDVPMIGWLLRKHHPKYVSKKELAYGVPAISYNLRHGGSVLIDRKNARQSIVALANFGKYLQEKRFAGCIFPEGTRSRDGNLKPFKTKGLDAILRKAPDAWIVPVVVYGNWEIERYKFRPVPFGIVCGCEILTPFKADEYEDIETLTEHAKASISTAYQKYFQA
ncbi:MAG: lysophospholipid acyltransferase family protein [Bacteroidota bacterium]